MLNEVGVFIPLVLRRHELQMNNKLDLYWSLRLLQKRDERGPRKFYKIKAGYESLTNDSDDRDRKDKFEKYFKV